MGHNRLAYGSRRPLLRLASPTGIVLLFCVFLQSMGDDAIDKDLHCHSVNRSLMKESLLGMDGSRFISQNR